MRGFTSNTNKTECSCLSCHSHIYVWAPSMGKNTYLSPCYCSSISSFLIFCPFAVVVVALRFVLAVFMWPLMWPGIRAIGSNNTTNCRSDFSSKSRGKLLTFYTGGEGQVGGDLQNSLFLSNFLWKFPSRFEDCANFFQRKITGAPKTHNIH